MDPVLLLVIYCTASVAFSLSGGWVPLVVQLTHRRMQVAISFVSGVVLGIGLLHLVPHSFLILRSIDATVLWVLAGILFMFFLERFFHFHHHDAPDEASAELLADDHHAHADHAGHAHVAGAARPATDFSWTGAAIGLTLHGLVDGVAIAAAVKAEEGHPTILLAGLGIALAVVLHKPFDALTIGTLMAAAGRSTASRHWLNAFYSLVTPLGVVLFYSTSDAWAAAVLGQILAFAGGVFICIALSDLLPELQFHRHDRATLSLALVAGIAMAWSTGWLEGSSHGHHEEAVPHEHEEGHQPHHDTDPHAHGA
jgi:zinc and cadmium transporter